MRPIRVLLRERDFHRARLAILRELTGHEVDGDAPTERGVRSLKRGVRRERDIALGGRDSASLARVGALTMAAPHIRRATRCHNRNQYT